MSRIIDRLVAKATAATSKMFAPVRVKKLSSHAENVKKVLSALAGGIKHDLALAFSAAMGETISLVAPQQPVVKGAVLFAVSNAVSGRHGYALRRPFMVAEDAGNGFVKGIRYHSGNVGKQIHLSETRKATAAEAKSFFKNNWEAKREKK